MEQWYVYEIRLSALRPDLIDRVNSLMMDWGALGTHTENAQGYYEASENLFGEIPLPHHPISDNELACVTAYFDHEQNIDQLSQAIQQCMDKEEYDISTSILDDLHWERNWQQYYQPQQLSRFIAIVPQWMNISTRSLEHHIFIDPGIAFGTGTHPTTQLGAQALEMIMQPGDNVIDVGCGTGILSLVASLLGANHVLGLDLDPQAVDAAKQNLSFQQDPILVSAINHQLIEFRVNYLLHGIDSKAEVIVANILPHILIDLLQDAHKLLKVKGHLILGGILYHKASEMAEAVSLHGFEIIYQSRMGEWVSLICQRKEDEPCNVISLTNC